MVIVRAALIVLLFLIASAARALPHQATPPRPVTAVLPLRIGPMLFMAIKDAILRPDDYPSRSPRTLALSLAPGAVRVLLKISAGALDRHDALAALDTKTNAASAFLIASGIDPRAIQPGEATVIWYDYRTHKWSGHWATRHLAVIVPDLGERPLIYSRLRKFGTINPALSIIRTRGAPCPFPC